jgi:regulator of replication initiation timing
MNSESQESSVQCVVRQLQLELDELLDRKARIKLRMRNLRVRLRSLERGASGALRKKHRRSQSLTRRAQADKLRELQEELYRACRIAFLELGGTATPEALHLAIVRRGSFSFAALQEEPIAAIIRTLTEMAQSGEATCSTNGSEPQWRHNQNLPRFQKLI